MGMNPRHSNTKFTASFDEVLKAIGISAIRTPVRSPKANAFAERWVRTVREDCLDHLRIYSMCHLQAVLADYVRHYNEARPHRGRQLAPPLPRHDQPRTGEICRRDIFGGIIHASTNTTGLPEVGTPGAGPSRAFNAVGRPPRSTAWTMGRRPPSRPTRRDLQSARTIGCSNGSRSRQSPHAPSPSSSWTLQALPLRAAAAASPGGRRTRRRAPRRLVRPLRPGRRSGPG